MATLKEFTKFFRNLLKEAGEQFAYDESYFSVSGKIVITDMDVVDSAQEIVDSHNKNMCEDKEYTSCGLWAEIKFDLIENDEYRIWIEGGRHEYNGNPFDDAADELEEDSDE